MNRMLPLMREFKALEHRRRSQGVTPLEYQRWCDLKETLAKALPGGGDQPAGAERRKNTRIPTRLLVEFRDREHLCEAIVKNISTGGLFINTAFGPSVGEELMVVIAVADDERVEVPCEVVTNNVDSALTTRRLGVGVKFKIQSPEQREAVDRLFAEALGMEYGPEIDACGPARGRAPDPRDEDALLRTQTRSFRKSTSWGRSMVVCPLK